MCSSNDAAVEQAKEYSIKSYCAARSGKSDEPLLSQRVTTLSGSEKQRVAIARANILDPCLILADEPTGNLDPKNRDIIFHLLRQEHEKGRGIILITHYADTAAQADTKYTLQDGALQISD